MVLWLFEGGALGGGGGVVQRRGGRETYDGEVLIHYTGGMPWASDKALLMV